MRDTVRRHGPGVIAMLSCALLFKWGWQPVILAAVAVITGWIDGYIIGREERP